MPPTSLIRAGHEITMPWRVPPKVRGDLLGPLERRVERPRPAHRVVREGLIGTPGVVPLHLLLERHDDAVERGELVRRTERGALGARAVVTADVDDQRVV